MYAKRQMLKGGIRKKKSTLTSTVPIYYNNSIMPQCEVLTSWVVSQLSIGSEYIPENGSTDLCITSSIWLWCSANHGTKRDSPQMGMSHGPQQDFTTDLAPTLCMSTEAINFKK